jgi:hypothetical protein
MQGLSLNSLTWISMDEPLKVAMPDIGNDEVEGSLQRESRRNNR